MSEAQMLQGDCLDVLKDLPDEFFDAVVTDPPYGLSKEPDVAEVMRHWIAGDRYEHGAQGFMGKTWDSFVPGPEYWREVYRVLKPGGHLLAFSGSRTWDLLSMAIRMAGFENRDTIGCPTLAWVQGQGFPKSKNLGDGRGTALKPAWEVILVFRKPLVGTVAENVLAHGTGAININGCRIGLASEGEDPRLGGKGSWGTGAMAATAYGKFAGVEVGSSPAGRWPANLVLVHADVCERVGTRSVPANGSIAPYTTAASSSKDQSVYGDDNRERGAWSPYGNGDGTETVDAWRCVEGCPVAALDAQSGSVSGRPGKQSRQAEPGDGWSMAHTGAEYADTGSASRFFYQAKASGEDRWFLCRVCGTAYLRKQIAEHVHDRTDRTHLVQHPTVKATDLIRWLCRLVTPPGGVILDPFGGTGSTGVAALREGFDAVLIEREVDYVSIAEARIAATPATPAGSSEFRGAVAQADPPGQPTRSRSSPSSG